MIIVVTVLRGEMDMIFILLTILKQVIQITAIIHTLTKKLNPDQKENSKKKNIT